MPQTCKRRPGGGGAADTSLAGDGPQHSKIDWKSLAAIDRASDSDRAWFAHHPARAYRLRPTVPGEFPGYTYPAGAERLALVKQLLPGTRQRSPMWAFQRPCDCDACLDGIWQEHAPDGLKRTMLDLAAALMLRGRA